MRAKGLLVLAFVLALFAGAATPVANADGPNAVRPDAGCTTNTLSGNDDGSTGAVPLGFNMDFFGTTYTHLFVNNNGNVTFGSSLSTYTPFGLQQALGRRIIAPFFADVDTRMGAPSQDVQYSFGGTTIDGRRAFCVNWVNVGYYAGHQDKTNSFQLVIIERSDIGAGDVDIEFNYDRIQWETGDASGGSNGLGGTSAAAGFSAGTGAVNTWHEFDGSRVNGAFLDSNAATGLVHGSRNAFGQNGRYVFELRNGMPPIGGGISGHVRDPNGTPLADAPVQVCPAGGGQCVFVTQTNVAGQYNATGLQEGSYIVRASSPAGSSLFPATEGPLSISGASELTQDLTLTGPTPPPADTHLSPARTGGGGIPVVYWNDLLDLTTEGCVGGSASYQVFRGGSMLASGAMAEGPAGTYSASVGPFFPNSGQAEFHISISCPDPAQNESFEFLVYIDPSGFVRTPSGNPVEGATVTLYRSDRATGPFVIVPDGSAIMSPVNRRNPDTTDAGGHFGWDVIAGFYKVRAEKDGCHAQGDPGLAFVETAVLPVPPIWTDLDLRLEGPGCPDDEIAPVVAIDAVPDANANGWNNSDVTLNVSAVDNPGGTGVASIACDGASAPGDSRVVLVDTEGTTEVSCTATDGAGNTSEPESVTVRLDKTAPEVTVNRSPAANANGWNNSEVTVEMTATDALSGIDGDASFTRTFGEGASQGASHTFADLAGNTTTRSVDGVNVDMTAPVLTCAATPAMLWPPNHKLWEVQLAVELTDALSGPDGYVLGSASSSEADSGLGDGDTANDVQGFEVGTADTAGQLRAERSGGGEGRRYELGYTGADRAGNAAACVAAVLVPHNR